MSDREKERKKEEERERETPKCPSSLHVLGLLQAGEYAFNTESRETVPLVLGESYRSGPLQETTTQNNGFIIIQ